jgi:hypothetical protein
MAVDDFFYDHDLFRHLDYQLTGRTLRGIIYINVTAYTDAAKQLIPQLRDLTISTDEETFNIAVLQIMTEKPNQLVAKGEASPDWNAIRDDLHAIEKRSWQDIDDVDMIFPLTDKEILANPGPLYASQNKVSAKPRNLRVAIELDKTFAEEHRELTPLFWWLASLMIENITNNLYATFGFYRRGAVGRPKHPATKLVHLFHVHALYPLELPTVIGEVEHELHGLGKARALARLLDELRSTTNNDPGKFMPGVRYMYEQTGILVGAKGWRRIATDENCKLILSNMKVTVSSGRERSTIKVGSVLNEQSNES